MRGEGNGVWQRLAKVIFTGGVMESGEINGHQTLQEAYQTVKQV